MDQLGLWTKKRISREVSEQYLQGKTSNALVQYEDLLPTLIDYAGGQIPAEIDGVSILPVLQGKKDQVREWAYGVHNNYPEGTPYPIRSIRKGKYKLILNLKADVPYYEKHLMNQKNYWGSWVRDASFSQAAAFWVNRYVNRPPVEFYDTDKDPWELHNLAFNPEIKTVMERNGKTASRMDEKPGRSGQIAGCGERLKEDTTRCRHGNMNTAY